MLDKDYIVVVRCDIVAERCSGYFCEKAFNEKEGGFADLDPAKKYRVMYLTCGGCCGRAVQRKVSHLLRLLKKKEGIERDRVVVQLSTCITRESHHGDICPHLDYIRNLLQKLDVEIREDTCISPAAEKRRISGEYGC